MCWQVFDCGAVQRWQARTRGSRSTRMERGTYLSSSACAQDINTGSSSLPHMPGIVPGRRRRPCGRRHRRRRARGCHSVRCRAQRTVASRTRRQLAVERGLSGREGASGGGRMRRTLIAALSRLDGQDLARHAGPSGCAALLCEGAHVAAGLGRVARAMGGKSLR